MSYDPEARATAMGGLTAGYRADGLRAWKSYLGNKTYFLYDGGRPVVELDVYGNVTGTNVFAPDGLVARGTSSGWTQYAFDGEGNVAQRLSATGTVLTSSVNDGYGNGSTIGTAVDCFSYHAKQGYYGDETGLLYCQNRYYDPGTGRWVTRDPIGYDGGINLYGYCGGRPVGRTDPLGLLSASINGCISVYIGVVFVGADAELCVGVSVGNGGVGIGASGSATAGAGFGIGVGANPGVSGSLSSGSGAEYNGTSSYTGGGAFGFGGWGGGAGGGGTLLGTDCDLFDGSGPFDGGHKYDPSGGVTGSVGGGEGVFYGFGGFAGPSKGLSTGITVPW